MLRGVIIFMVAVLTAACASVMDGVQQAAQSRFQQLLAGKFADKLGEGVDWVVNSLAQEGGFLDDPLVRVLLPPPLGLVIDVARDLQADPKAALLETLMNRAAENAIPVAGPILKNLVTNMDQATLEELVQSPQTAATEYLRNQAGAQLQAALLPAVGASLRENGAVQLYSELLVTHEKAQVAAAGIEDAAGEVAVVDSVAPDMLGHYVAEQATAGLFKKFAVKELAIRQELEDQKQALPDAAAAGGVFDRVRQQGLDAASQR